MITKPALATYQADSGRDPGRDGFRMSFREVASDASRLLSEGWVYVDGGSDIVEYGRGKWNDRILQSVVVRVRIRVKNADIGAYQDRCFDIAFLNDPEFQRLRSPVSFACDRPE